MASFSFDLRTGNGPFTIVIRATTDPVTTNRYISGTIPGVIEYTAIEDGLPHDYVVDITSPSCEPFRGQFSYTAPCSAKPAVNVTQDCTSFASTNKAFVNVSATLQGYSTVLLQIYNGSSTVTAQNIDTGVVKRVEIPNNITARIRVSNPLYSTCYTEINYQIKCSTVACDTDINIGQVNPDQVNSTTPTPNITSAVISNGQTVITGTSVCNGFIRLYRRSITTNAWVAITDRTIAVTNGTWSYTVNSASTETYGADALCSQYTSPSAISGGFSSVVTPVDPDPEPDDVISRTYLSYNPNSNTFITAQVTPETAQVEARLVSTGNTTQWLTLSDWGSVFEGKAYNKRLVISNLPQGNYTITIRNKNNTSESYSSTVTVANSAINQSLYDSSAGSDPSTPTIPDGLITGADVPKSEIYFDTPYFRIGFHLGQGGAITYLKPVDAPDNIVNNYDYGRQLQYALYGWPVVGFRPEGKLPAAQQWNEIGWDPIQTGDFDTPSVVTQYKKIDNNNIYFRTIPRHWGYRNSPAECYVDTWVKIDGRKIEQTNILTNHRTDQFDNLNRGQDWAGGFINARWFRAKVYWGNQPFTNQPLTDFDMGENIPNITETGNQYGVKSMVNTERWIYAYNADYPSRIGLGLWSKTPRFSTSMVANANGVYKVDEGVYGGPCVTIGNHLDAEQMERNIVYRWDYAFVLGSVDDIRSYAYDRKDDLLGPSWDFSVGKQHWWSSPFSGGAFTAQEQTEYPHPGVWRIRYDTKYANIISPDTALLASNYTRFEITMAITGSHTQAGINFTKRRNNGYRFNQNGYVAVDDVRYTWNYIPDGQMRTYVLDLPSNPDWGGVIGKIYIDMNGGPEAGRYLELKSINLR